MKTFVDISLAGGMPFLLLISLVSTFATFFCENKYRNAITAKILFFSLFYYMVVGGMMIRVEYCDSWLGLIIRILYMLFVVAMIGSLSILQIIFLQRKEEYEKIGRTWRMLKFGSIIYVCLNAVFWYYIFQVDKSTQDIRFIFEVFIYAVLYVFSPYVLIPLWVSAISGYCGYIYIDYLKEQSEGDKRKLTILSGCQFVPIMDYICMRIIWKKYKKN